MQLQSITQKKHELTTPSDEFAAALSQAGNELGPASPYGEALLKASESRKCKLECFCLESQVTRKLIPTRVFFYLLNCVSTGAIE